MARAVARAVEEQWLLHFIGDGHDWVPPEISARSLGGLSPKHPDSVASAVRWQIFHHGFPDTLRAPVLARALAAQALLTVRVDRWERIMEPNPTVTTAYVDLTAALVDSAGRLLWQIAGGQRQLSKYGVPQVTQGAVGEIEIRPRTNRGRGGYTPSRREVFRPGTSTSGSEPGPGLGPDFDVALAGLFERWYKAYPFALPDRAGIGGGSIP